MSAKAGKPPLLLRYRSSTVFILTTVGVAVFADYFLYGVLVPVFPFALVNQSGIDQKDVQRWTSSLSAIYGSCVCLFSPLCGYVADYTASRRMPLLFGLILLAAGTALMCVGNNVALLAAGRALQGLSGAVIYTIGPALVVDTVQPRHVAQAMGWIGWAMTIGTIISPLLGGVVFDKAGYRAIFAIVFSLIGIDTLLRLGMVEKKIAIRWSKSSPHRRGEKSQSQFTSEGDCTAHRDDENDFLEKTVVASVGSTVISIFSSPKAVFFRGSEKLRRAPKPTLLSLLTEPRLLAALWGVFAQAIMITAFDAVLAIFVQSVFNWNATAAGICFLPLLIPAFFGPMIGYVADRFGARWPATLGFLLATPGFICLRFITHNTLSQKLLLCVLLVIIGLAVTSILVPLMGEIAAIVADGEKKNAYAQGYGLFNLAFGGGTVAGPLMAGYVRNRCGWGAMTLMLGCLSAASGRIAVVWTGSKPSIESRDDCELDIP